MTFTCNFEISNESSAVMYTEILLLSLLFLHAGRVDELDFFKNLPTHPPLLSLILTSSLPVLAERKARAARPARP
jgi:hypothetical protein